MAILDMMVTNGWYLSGIPGLTNPHFETLDGIGVESNNVETVDHATNKRMRFSTQIQDFTEMTLTRPFQSNKDDYALQIFSMACIKQGFKVDVVATKKHKLTDVFQILLNGFRIRTISLPSLNVEGEEKFSVTYACTCDEWFIVPVQFEVTGPVTLPTPILGVPIPS